MPRTESRTKTAIWNDDEFTSALTGAGQRMYWLLYSQSTINLCGVLALTERRWAKTAKGETLETVRAALSELAAEGYILIDYDTEEVFVRTFAKHDGVARSPRTFHSAWRQLRSISSPIIRQAAEDGLAEQGPPPPDWDGTGDRGSDETSWPVNGVSGTPPDGVSGTPPDGVSGTPPDGVPNGVPDRTGGRAHAVSDSCLLSPSPDTRLPPGFAAAPPPLCLLPDPAPTFDDFWALYPLKTGKSKAAKAYAKLDPGEARRAVADLEARWVGYWATPGSDFTPHASTWLNLRRFEDDELPPVRGRQAQPQGDRSLDAILATSRSDARGATGREVGA